MARVSSVFLVAHASIATSCLFTILAQIISVLKSVCRRVVWNLGLTASTGLVDVRSVTGTLGNTSSREKHVLQELLERQGRKVYFYAGCRYLGRENTRRACCAHALDM